MRIRRCAMLWLEAVEHTWFELEDVLAGGTGVRSALAWQAHAAHLPAPVLLDQSGITLLGDVSPSGWVAASALRTAHGAARVRELLRAGLLIGSTKAWATHRHADEAVRAGHWHPASAVMHRAARWDGIDAAAAMHDAGAETGAQLLQKFGPAPPAIHTRSDARASTALPAPDHDELDALLDARATCRNFDASASLALPTLSRVLARSFGARGKIKIGEGLELIKRTAPSGGGLHPTECYLIVQRVDDLQPGLYHYHVGRHALDLLQESSADELAAFALSAVAGQTWFANAPVLCVLAPRFARNHWKYRNHAKAYRVCILDVGHLSHVLQLSATREGLGSFITAAINEAQIDQAFGLDGLSEGALAVCGIGPRADTMSHIEFDPGHRVWPRG